jgi:dihydropteroate synthase
VNHDLVFGPLALELNPGAVASAGLDLAAGQIAVAFNSHGLHGAARAFLGRLAGARFHAAPGPGREVLCIGAEALAAAAIRCPQAEVLLEARKCLERKPDRPEIMGVINVTPDSFSDGGEFLDPQRAVEHGLELIADGATLLDIGGESTRPGAEPVTAAEETRRILPVVTMLARQSSARISIDTSKASVARAALDAGATMVNDVSSGEADPEMLPLIAEQDCDYVIMHAQGRPQEMQNSPRYEDAPSEVLGYLRRRVADCLQLGIDVSRILVDPGIGFGKLLEHNTALLCRLPELRSLGRPLLLGVSRKSFIGHITGKASGPRQARRPDHDDRLGGTAAAVTVCVLAGADVLRVHDVAVLSETIQVAAALRTPDAPLATHAEQKGKRTHCPSI